MSEDFVGAGLATYRVSFMFSMFSYLPLTVIATLRKASSLFCIFVCKFLRGLILDPILLKVRIVEILLECSYQRNRSLNKN